MNATTISSQMTPKQHEFATKLLREAEELLQQRDGLLGKPVAATAAFLVQAIMPLHDELNGGQVTKRRASQIIDLALDNNKATRREIEAAMFERGRALGMDHAEAADYAAPHGAPVNAQAFVTTGMYRVGEDIYKVLPSRNSDRHYAKKLAGTTEDGFTFEYAKGAMRLIRPEHKMTAEQAAEFGKLTGTCCCCGKLLTKPESIAKGIGPVCEGKYF